MGGQTAPDGDEHTDLSGRTQTDADADALGKTDGDEHSASYLRNHAAQKIYARCVYLRLCRISAWASEAHSHAEPLAFRIRSYTICAKERKYLGEIALD